MDLGGGGVAEVDIPTASGHRSHASGHKSQGLTGSGAGGGVTMS